jgi:ADP-ribose pyrophosphatase YjhB (NUDIX family)
MDHQDVSACTNATCRFVLWANSKPCASIVVANNLGEILLTTRAIEPDKGKLDLPGGFLQLGEHPYDGARREAREELQVEIEPEGILGFAMDTYGSDGDSTLNMCIL